MHVNSRLAFQEHAAPRIPHNARILEIGPDKTPSTYCNLAGNPPGWETADLASQAGEWSIDHSVAQLLMPNEYEIPAPDNTYDVVMSGNVAEHVPQIWRWMAELARVTKPGGQVITVSPISWIYHEAPVDCWRMYPAAMEAISEYAGLTVTYSWWGSLERLASRRTYPGAGDDEGWGHPYQGRGWKGLVRRVLGWPVPIAYDLVTIATK